MIINIMVSLLCTLAHIPSLILRFVPFKEMVTRKQRKYLWEIYIAGLLAVFILRLAEKDGISVSFYKINLLLFCVIMGLVNIVVIKGHLKEQLFTFGLPLAVIMAIVVWVVLEKTKFGFELKATGMNKNAAKYCGMKEKRNIIVTMMIAGGLAGLGAAAFYLSGIETWMV